MKKCYIGIDVGGTKISAAVVRPSGKIIARQKVPTPPGGQARAIIHVIRDLVEVLLWDTSLKPKHIVGCGVGIPGIVDTASGTVIATPNLRLSGCPLSGKLAKELRMPVVAGNDVNVGLLGEQWCGAAKGYKDVVAVFVGTGVGGAIISDGRLITGGAGAAGEIGHMTIEADGPLCSCGNRGCLEAVAGRWAIERDIRRALKKGKVSPVIGEKIRRSAPIKSKLLETALSAHDPLVTAVMKRACHYLGLACISINHIFNPEAIVFGGGVIEACTEFMLPLVRATFVKDPFFKKLPRCKIVPSLLGDDAVLLGAAALAKASL